ncbi:MAG: ATP-dependent Clp protease adaptor ClpS [Bacteroidales bacterium]
MTKSKEKKKLEEFIDISDEEKKVLVLHNDDYNYFDFVIKTLVKVCKHTETQAEQCAMIVHLKGKCDVKQGEFKQLKPMKEALIDHGLNATIE